MYYVGTYAVIAAKMSAEQMGKPPTILGINLEVISGQLWLLMSRLFQKPQGGVSNQACLLRSRELREMNCVFKCVSTRKCQFSNELVNIITHCRYVLIILVTCIGHKHIYQLVDVGTSYELLNSEPVGYIRTQTF